MFCWNSLAFSMIHQKLAIWSLVPLPFLKPAWTFGSSWFKYCWSLAWRILSITLLACEMSAIVWQFEYSLALPFFGIGMKTDLFQSCGHCWVFSLVKAMVFPVVMYRCDWTIKKAERRRSDAFGLQCWKRLLRVPWTARRSNQSFLKEISPGCSLEGLMLKLKLHYFGHLMWRVDSFEKTLMLGKIEGGRRRGWQRMRWLDGITDSMDEFE